MKFIKLYENFNIGFSKNELKYYFHNIKIKENDEYIILDLSKVFLDNDKLDILYDVLLNKTIIFNCDTHRFKKSEQEEIKVTNTSTVITIENGDDLIVYDGKRGHKVDLKYPIKISKLNIEMNKYNI